MVDRKEYFKEYYIRKIKPFRKKKQPVGYHSFVCPICKRRSFMRNLKYDMPFSVDMVFFEGDKGIKWFRGRFKPEQKEIIVQLIKVKLIQAMKEFGITAEDLGIRIGGVVLTSFIRATPLIRTNSHIKIGGIR